MGHVSGKEDAPMGYFLMNMFAMILAGVIVGLILRYLGV